MVVPTYYREFRCLAGACRHNCCIGWEIDIDEETLARYRAVPGEAGERLRRQITGDPPHFVLDNEERCPFLTAENLCGYSDAWGGFPVPDLPDSPRYRNFWPADGGGARRDLRGGCAVILSQETPFDSRTGRLRAHGWLRAGNCMRCARGRSRGETLPTRRPGGRRTASGRTQYSKKTAREWAAF
jgi:hypothetical protein